MGADVKAWEAMKALQEGERVRDTDGDEYVLRDTLCVYAANGSRANVCPRYEPYSVVQQELTDEEIASELDKWSMAAITETGREIARDAAKMVRTRRMP